MPRPNAPFHSYAPFAGFTMTFENGYEISVRWGRANYCTNRSYEDGPDPVTSNTAEVAIFQPNGSWHVFEDGRMCQGWETPDKVADWIEYCRNL